VHPTSVGRSTKHVNKGGCVADRGLLLLESVVALDGVKGAGVKVKKVKKKKKSEQWEVTTLGKGVFALETTLQEREGGLFRIPPQT